MSAARVVEVRGLHVHHSGVRAGTVRAVDGVDLAIDAGETLGLVGESGCGKSTLARALLRLLQPTAGTITFQGRDITNMRARELRPLRRHMQMVFQDPYASLNPRMRVLDIIGEALDIHGLAADHVARRARVLQLVRKVGLGDDSLSQFPHELSGGMRQRVGIARALAVEPSFLVCDEPVSALDASVRAQVVNLLADLRDELGLTMLFIAHDLAVVRHLTTRVAVMYLGRIVEEAATQELFARPLHPYTKALLAAAPVPDPTQRRAGGALAGEPGSPLHIPPGCRFHPRCPEAIDRCRTEDPALVAIGATRVACHVVAARSP